MPGSSPVSDRIPVAPLRKAFERSGLSLREVCRRLDWHAPSGQPDTARLKRALGIYPSFNGDRMTYAARIGIPHAERIARAIDADPVDVGL